MLHSGPSSVINEVCDSCVVREKSAVNQSIALLFECHWLGKRTREFDTASTKYHSTAVSNCARHRNALTSCSYAALLSSCSYAALRSSCSYAPLSSFSCATLRSFSYAPPSSLFSYATLRSLFSCAPMSSLLAAGLLFGPCFVKYPGRCLFLQTALGGLKPPGLWIDSQRIYSLTPAGRHQSGGL